MASLTASSSSTANVLVGSANYSNQKEKFLKDFRNEIDELNESTAQELFAQFIKNIPQISRYQEISVPLDHMIEEILTTPCSNSMVAEDYERLQLKRAYSIIGILIIHNLCSTFNVYMQTAVGLGLYDIAAKREDYPVSVLQADQATLQILIKTLCSCAPSEIGGKAYRVLIGEQIENCKDGGENYRLISKLLQRLIKEMDKFQFVKDFDNPCDMDVCKHDEKSTMTDALKKA